MTWFLSQRHGDKEEELGEMERFKRHHQIQCVALDSILNCTNQLQKDIFGTSGKLANGWSIG